MNKLTRLKKMQEVHQYVNAYVLFALGMGAKIQ